MKPDQTPGQPAALITRITSILCLLATITSCANGITKKQKDSLSEHAADVAAAIHASVKYVKAPLYDYYVNTGHWPANQEEQHSFSLLVKSVLEPHHINNLQLVSVDKQEVIVEFFLSFESHPQLPRLMESWVIVFSASKANELDIVSIYPVWGEPENLAANSAFKSKDIEQYQVEFRHHLYDKLENYSIQLNENFDSLAG